MEVRTEANVIDSDGTLILTAGSPVDGTGYTIACAERYEKPCFVVDLEEPPAPTAVKTWLNTHQIGVLNVAGPRESHRPGFIYRAASEFLTRVLSGG